MKQKKTKTGVKQTVHIGLITKITETGKAYLVTNYKRMFKEIMQGK